MTHPGYILPCLIAAPTSATNSAGAHGRAASQDPGDSISSGHVSDLLPGLAEDFIPRGLPAHLPDQPIVVGRVDSLMDRDVIRIVGRELIGLLEGSHGLRRILPV